MNQESSSPFVTKVLLRQSIDSVRLVIALFTVGATVTKLLYNQFLPNLADLDEARWSIIALGCLFFLITFIRYKRAVVVTYFSFFLYLITLIYVITFVLINQFDPNAVTILILVVGASTIIISSLFYYGMQCLVIMVSSLYVYLSFPMSLENLAAFLNLIFSLGVFGIVLAVRLKLISSVKNSHDNLEKLNVLSIVANKSGEIVFVSPSVQRLLGYDPSELVKEGWWSAHNLREGWINRDYILNYPNIFPKEIASMETSISDKTEKRCG